MLGIFIVVSSPDGTPIMTASRSGDREQVYAFLREVAARFHVTLAVPEDTERLWNATGITPDGDKLHAFVTEQDPDVDPGIAEAEFTADAYAWSIDPTRTIDERLPDVIVDKLPPIEGE